MNGIKQTKNGSFRIDKIYKGIRIVSTRKTYEEAVSFLNEKIESINSGRYFEKVEEDKLLNSIFKEVYYKRIKITTYNKQKFIFEKYLAKMIPKKIEDITNEKILSIYEYFVENKNNIPITSLNRSIVFLKEIIIFINEKYDKNLKYSFLKRFKKDKEISEKLEQNFLEYNEFLTLIKAIESLEYFRCIYSLKHITLMLNVLYYTGCRYGEAMAITRDSFKIIKNRFSKTNTCGIIIDKHIYEKNIIKGTKTSSTGRFVLLEKNIYNMLLKQIEELGLQNDYIFKSLSTRYVLNNTSFPLLYKRLFKTLKEEKLLPEEFPDYISPHGYRYSNGLYLKYQLKISDELAAKNQGHSLTMHLNTYSRVARSEIDDKFGF